jgi:hypothetical protein
MSVHGSAGWVALALAALTYGCGPAQQAVVAPAAKPGADVPAVRLDASRPAIDPRILPPPRPPLGSAPDLMDAEFAVNDATLTAMAEDGLPQPLAERERRADSVRKALVAAGVPAARLKTVSCREERPAAAGHGEAAWSKNRRAVINLL